MSFLRRIDGSDIFFLDVKNKIDHRGGLCKVFQESWFTGNFNFTPKECYFSTSNENVLRGFHLQINESSQGKIVSCISGKVLDVVVDLRMGTNFGKVYSTYLDSNSSDTIFIPKGFGHSFLNLEQNQAVLLYLVETEHDPINDTGVLWNSVNYNWPIKDPLISSRDKSLPNIESFEPLIL